MEKALVWGIKKRNRDFLVCLLKVFTYTFVRFTSNRLHLVTLTLLFFHSVREKKAALQWCISYKNESRMCVCSHQRQFSSGPEAQPWGTPWSSGSQRVTFFSENWYGPSKQPRDKEPVKHSRLAGYHTAFKIKDKSAAGLSFATCEKQPRSVATHARGMHPPDPPRVGGCCMLYERINSMSSHSVSCSTVLGCCENRISLWVGSKQEPPQHVASACATHFLLM